MGKECTDIDECTEFRGFCKGNLHCTNTVGSYLCGCRFGFETITTIDWTLMKETLGCVDTDECVDQDICPKNSVCLNSPGNYTCQCHTGFAGDLCEDIDECSPVSKCDANATCLNSYGSYKCSCNTGFHGDGKICEIGQCDDRWCGSDQKCVSPTTNDCECNEGLSYNQTTELCEDINECSLGNYCDRNTVCSNSKGSFSCTCNSGYFGNGKTCQVGSCTDDVCSLNEECVSPTGIDCRCKAGFERDDTKICLDIDECGAEDSCDQNADCFNTDGSYECKCRQGFFGDGLSCFTGTCSDSNCPEKQKCVSPTTLDCECIVGFLFDEYSTCVDVDECEQEPCSENAECLNTEGTFNCSCSTGFVGDGFSCSDIDECVDNVHDCSYEAECINTKGSFTCSCDRGIGAICTSKWILVLNTGNPYVNTQNPVPLIINGKGDSKEIGFNFEDKTQVHGSCSIVWQGLMYIFGGLSLKRQISVVDQCKLTSKGELQFDMSFGACAQRENDEIYICFENQQNMATAQNCRRAFSPLGTFSKLPNSIYTHRRTRIAVTSGKL